MCRNIGLFQWPWSQILAYYQQRHSLVNQIRKSLPSTKNPHLIMMKSQTWTLSHLKMVLGPLMKFLGIHFIVQRRVFWLEKQIFHPFCMEVVLFLLLKWEDSHYTKAQKYPWHHNIFGNPSSLHQHRSEQLLNNPSQLLFSTLVPWKQIHQQ